MKVEKIIDKLQNGETILEDEMTFIVNGFTNESISDSDMSSFLLLIKDKGLSYQETFYLTKAMINTGDILDLSNLNRVIVDKHSTGGVGDKVTFLVSPIVASLGLGVAKMSGRSLGFTGGTIDKLESIPGYKVNLSNREFESNVNHYGISIISQTGSLAPADKKIYALRDEIGAVESIPLIASSIMSKKVASGAPYIVIDLKVGSGAFMKDKSSALVLADYMIKIGEYFGRKVICVLTDMNNPLGYTVGNSIEVIEAKEFFDGKREKRLEELVVTLASYMVSLGKSISYEEARLSVLEVLSSGKAKDKFYEWIRVQGGNIDEISLGDKKIEFKASKSGYIKSINPINISKVLFLLGAGRERKEDTIDYSVGVRFNYSLYDKVNEGDVLFEIYYNKENSIILNDLDSIVEIESILEEEKDIIISVIK